MNNSGYFWLLTAGLDNQGSTIDFTIYVYILPYETNKVDRLFLNQFPPAKNINETLTASISLLSIGEEPIPQGLPLSIHLAILAIFFSKKTDEFPSTKKKSNVLL